MAKEDDRDATSRGNRPSLDTLLQRQQSDKPVPRAGKSSSGGGRAAPEKSLQQILDGLVESQAIQPASANPGSADGRYRGQTTPDLTDAIQKSLNADSATKQLAGARNRVHAQSLPGVAELRSREQQKEGSRPDSSPAFPNSRPVGLDEAVLQRAGTEDPLPGKVGESSTWRGRRRLVAVALGGLMLALAAGTLFRKDDAVPDSAVARRLLVVAEDVARYRAANQKLPERLSELPGFPKDAVEWPIENYALQLVDPRLEFFFVDAAGSYIVIARFSDEVWVYDSLKAKPLRRVPPG